MLSDDINHPNNIIDSHLNCNRRTRRWLSRSTYNNSFLLLLLLFHFSTHNVYHYFVSHLDTRVIDVLKRYICDTSNTSDVMAESKKKKYIFYFSFGEITSNNSESLKHLYDIFDDHLNRHACNSIFVFFFLCIKNIFSLIFTGTLIFY